jgi:hypothetical protein
MPPQGQATWKIGTECPKSAVWGQSRRLYDVCLSVRSTIPDILTSPWDRSACRLPVPKLQMTGATAAAPDDRLNCFGGAYRQRIDGTKVAGNLLLRRTRHDSYV